MSVTDLIKVKNIQHIDKCPAQHVTPCQNTLLISVAPGLIQCIPSIFFRISSRVLHIKDSFMI